MYLTAVLFANSTPGELHVGELSSGEQFVRESEIMSWSTELMLHLGV